MLRSRVTTIVLAVFVVALGLTAFGISKAQDQLHDGLVSRFNERAGFGSLFLGSLLDLSTQARVKQAMNELGSPDPDARTLRRFMKKAAPQQRPYALLLDSKGQVLASVPPAAGRDPKLLAHNPDLSVALHKNVPYTGNVIRSPRGDQIVEFAVPFETPYGRRVIATGSPLALFNAFMKPFLQGIPAIKGGEAYLLDANDRVLASAGPSHVGARLNDPALLAALHRGSSGRYQAGEARRFVQRRMPKSSLGFALSVPETALFATINKGSKLIWTLYGVLAVSIVAGLMVLIRVYTRNRQLALAEQAQRARAELAQEQQRANAEAERLKSEFFGIVSHELRTPLTSITGYVELLQELDRAELTESGQGRLEVVHRNARRLDRLVQDLLMLTQLEAGTFSIDPGEVDVCKLARELEPEAMLMAEVADVTLSVECDGIPVFKGDSTRIAQVLDNLISNAIKFTPKGGRVGVRIHPEGERCVVEVSDTGVGIDAKDLKQLFKRFYRGVAIPAGKMPGAGLGLAIVEAIVQAHEGEIAVESKPGQGATFRVYLPLTPPPLRRPASQSQRRTGRERSEPAALRR
jgi:signal transduction histidine kinase